MLSVRVIPCLDVYNGRTVKGINFINLQDAGDPVEQAYMYSNIGADEICFLDIGATNEKKNIMFDVISRTAETCFVPLTVGGGVNDIKDFRNLLNCGADKISINSSAVKNPNLIKEASDKFGNQCVVLAIDAKTNVNMNSGYEVTTHGGRNKTGIDVMEWAEKGVLNGAGEILLTSMISDGTKKGYNLELIKLIAENVSVPVIASGGAGEPNDMVDVVLKSSASAVLAASIFHFGIFSIKAVKYEMQKNGISVRICGN
ncbi:imidazole glycerol phosphate synthase subunit HisF [Alphaproteobacteria bacterium]|nr:imidazole glycerol phosphate synthase subunit HisF [Alphaproteobacteria bacterium]MDB9915723.1 imidazole glycerol phosphate synthase subunit HisF [Alphaproteobacteria bacterium]